MKDFLQHVAINLQQIPARRNPFHGPVVSGIRAKIIGAFLVCHVFLLLTLQLKNPVAVFKVWESFRSKRKKLQGQAWITKYVKAQGRYFFSENIPGWPSPAFNAYLKGEIARASRGNQELFALQTVILAITSRCPLACRHCYEGHHLAREESLSVEDLKNILSKIQLLGIHHVQLSGGEPLARFDDLLVMLYAARKGTDFWLATSGFGLTLEKALALRKAGITGVNISLDHWDADFHNAFRGNNHAFYWAGEAAVNCRKAGLLTGLSLCATKEFLSAENLMRYNRLATDWGICFIRILEPRNAGKYRDCDVALESKHIVLLEQFFQLANFSPRFRNAPIIMYPGYHQRRLGCFGAGNSYFYIDPRGDVHACPFCQQKAGNAKHEPFIPVIRKLKKMGCMAFPLNNSD